MNTTVLLFERYKASIEARSDRRAAMSLGVKVQTVSNWRTRGSQAEAATIDAMCKQLNEDPMPWLMRIQAEQGGPDSANGVVWKRVATRLGVSLATLALAVTDLVLEGMQTALTTSADAMVWSSAVLGSVSIPGV